VPSGLLPVLEIDGRVVTESATIMALLEEQFPNHKPLMPAADSPQRPRADQLMRLERRFFSDWLNWLCRSGRFEPVTILYMWRGGVASVVVRQSQPSHMDVQD
jgi:glutathione S-transferase